MTLATGYARNGDRRALPTYRRIGAPPLPSSVDLKGFARTTTLAPIPIFDQGATSSCVGHATARGIAIARAFLGSPLAFVPSPDALYRVARCLERDWNTPLLDMGCDPIDMIDAMQRWGARAMGPMAPDGRYSDADPSTINSEPTLGDLEWSSDLLMFDDHEVVGVGQDRVDAVALALAAGQPVRIVVPGGSGAWQGYDGTTILSDVGGAPLDHCVVLTGFAPGYFEGANSWGASWGLGGFFRCDDSVIVRSNDSIVTVARLP